MKIWAFFPGTSEKTPPHTFSQAEPQNPEFLSENEEHETPPCIVIVGIQRALVAVSSAQTTQSPHIRNKLLQS